MVENLRLPDIEFALLAEQPTTFKGQLYTLKPEFFLDLIDGIRQMFTDAEMLRKAYEMACSDLMEKLRRKEQPEQNEVMMALGMASILLMQPGESRGTTGYLLRTSLDGSYQTIRFKSPLRPYYEAKVGLEPLWKETQAVVDNDPSPVIEHDPPRRGTLPTHAVHAVMSSFLTAVKSGKVRECVRYEGSRPVVKGSQPAVAVSAQAFDFGDFSAVRDLPFDQADRLFKEAADHKLVLPFDPCFFVFKKGLAYSILYLRTLEGNVVIDEYAGTPPNEKIVDDVWVLEDARIIVKNGQWATDGKVAAEIKVKLKPGMATELRDKLASAASVNAATICLAAWLLNKPRTVRERGEEIRVPKRLMLSTRRPLPPVIHVNIDREVVAEAGQPGPGTGTTRCPHDRRKHIRRLRDGREIEVRASKIHGGAKAPRYYEVTE